MMLLPLILALCKGVYVAVIAALFVQYRMLLGSRESEAYTAFLRKHITAGTFNNLHGICTLLVFFVFEGAGDAPGTQALLYLTGCLLAWLMWDGGYVGTLQPKTALFGSCHHIGALIALPYQLAATPESARRNTLMFGWLWFVHSIVAVEKAVTLFTGYTRQKGDKTVLMTRFREAYAVVTVYLIHVYFHGEGQPGLRWNYQTASLTLLLLGRYLVADNYFNVPFLRRVEVPGATLVYASALSGGYARGAIITLALVFAIVARAVRMKASMPSRFDPQHKEIEKVLAKWEHKFSGMVDKSDGDNGDGGLEPGITQVAHKIPKAVRKFCATKPKWHVKYPVIMAVGENDFTKLQTLVAAKEDMHVKMPEWWYSNAIQWACHLGRLSCAVHLMQRGVNPYTQGAWEAVRREKISNLQLLYEDLHPVAMEAFPPEHQNMGALGRIREVLRRF